MNKSTLSVIIITLNESHDIRACLESVRWADEIIVIDSGSTDDTVAICREYTDKVFVTDWPGYGVQKNRALQQASQEWVLSLDADEVVTAELQREILQNILQENYAAYLIPIETVYCDKPIRWHRKLHLRLFKRSMGKFNDAIVHENIIVTGKIGKLKTFIKHNTYRTLEEMLDKMNAYSTKKAEQLLKKGNKGSLLSAITHGLWAFFRSYIFRVGFLDGKAGFMLSVSSAQYTYYAYLKLMLLQTKV